MVHNPSRMTPTVMNRIGTRRFKLALTYPCSPSNKAPQEFTHSLALLGFSFMRQQPQRLIPGESFVHHLRTLQNRKASRTSEWNWLSSGKLPNHQITIPRQVGERGMDHVMTNDHILMADSQLHQDSNVSCLRNLNSALVHPLP